MGNRLRELVALEQANKDVHNQSQRLASVYTELQMSAARDQLTIENMKTELTILAEATAGTVWRCQTFSTMHAALTFSIALPGVCHPHLCTEPFTSWSEICMVYWSRFVQCTLICPPHPSMLWDCCRLILKWLQVSSIWSWGVCERSCRHWRFKARTSAMSRSNTGRDTGRTSRNP